MSKHIKESANNADRSSAAGGLLFMLKTVFFAYCISVLLLFLTALFATFNPLSDSIIAIAVNTITAIGVSFCGFMSGRHFGSKGLIFGALCGILYAVLLWLLGALVSPNPSFGASAFTALAIGTVCGAVGGIIGINTKKQRRR